MDLINQGYIVMMVHFKTDTYKQQYHVILLLSKGFKSLFLNTFFFGRISLLVYSPHLLYIPAEDSKAGFTLGQWVRRR